MKPMFDTSKLASILEDEGLIKTAAPRGKSLSEAYATVEPGDEVLIVSGRTGKGERHRVTFIRSQMGAKKVHWADEDADPLIGTPSTSISNVKVLKPAYGKGGWNKLYKVGQTVEVVGGMRAPRGMVGEIISIVSNPMGRHFLLRDDAGKEEWVSGDQVKPA